MYCAVGAQSHNFDQITISARSEPLLASAAYRLGTRRRTIEQFLVHEVAHPGAAYLGVDALALEESAGSCGVIVDRFAAERHVRRTFHLRLFLNEPVSIRRAPY